MTGTADRELRAEAHVAATPDQVWAVLGDVRRMPGLSTELVRMLALTPGGLRRGQWYLGINRRGYVFWPTRSIVTDVEPGRLLAWDTASSGARWIWELAPEDDGTRVVHRRPVPRRLTYVARVFARVFLGGISHHVDDLEGDMRQSVDRLKRVAETGPTR
jgi:uncharacterized protein YndB with AHSA1/START domain